ERNRADGRCPGPRPAAAACRRGSRAGVASSGRAHAHTDRGKPAGNVNRHGSPAARGGLSASRAPHNASCRQAAGSPRVAGRRGYAWEWSPVESVLMFTYCPIFGICKRPISQKNGVSKKKEGTGKSIGLSAL